MPPAIVGYKVVTCRGNNNLYSYSGYLKYMSTYAVNVVTNRQRGCGPLAVFSTLEAAVRFCCPSPLPPNEKHIYKCEYIPSSERGLWVPAEDEIVRLHPGSIVRHSDKYPPGTVFADAVMLRLRMK